MREKKRKTEKSLLFRLSNNLTISFRIASFVSEHIKEKTVSPVSVLAGIVLNENSLTRKVLLEMNIPTSDILEKILGRRSIEITRDFTVGKEIALSKETKEVMDGAYLFAQRAGHIYVGTEHMMLAILKSNIGSISKLVKIGLTYESFRAALSRIAIYPLGVLAKPMTFPAEEQNMGIMEYLGVDLVDLARRNLLDPVIGREKEIDQLVNILSRRKKSNPVVVGEAGVGKTVLVEGLAQRIASGNVHPSLQNAKIMSLDISSIMAGSKMRGDVEEKVMAIIEEVSTSENTILFIDEIHNIVAPGMPGSSSDIASVLKPALTQGNFRCIGATTTEEYSAYFESDTALARRFQPIFLKELSAEQSIEILNKMKPILEKHHRVKISDEAIDVAVNLSDRYVADRYLPDKAIDILDEASAQKKLNVELDFGDIHNQKEKLKILTLQKRELILSGNVGKAMLIEEKEEKLRKKIKTREKEYLDEKKKKKNEITTEDIKEIVSKWTGIPLNTLGSREKNSLINLGSQIEKEVIGQEEACETVANAIKRARTGIIDSDRPWASFLFLGPTGVGKTELAKVLTEKLFGNEDNLIQIDMSEMMEMHSVAKLIGSPPGYIGYQQGGWLTEKVRRHPHSVILFDEIEKAHPDVLNVLLQILEYGHLMDGRGRRVNFKNTVVILTSNIGAEEIKKDKVLGFSSGRESERTDSDIDKAYDSMRDALLEELRDSLRPELLNRIDDIVIFRALTRKDARKIVKILIGKLNTRLKEESIVVSLDSSAVSYVVKEAFSEEYGARPLRRFIQDKVENLLADFILERDTGLTNRKVIGVSITLKDDTLVISKAK